MRWSAVVLGLLVAAGCGEAPSVPPGMPAGDLALHWELAETRPLLGSPIPARLWMRVANGVQAEPPVAARLLAETEGLRIRATDDGIWYATERGRVHVRSYELQWLRLGPQTLPAIEHEARAPDHAEGTSLIARTEPLDFEVGAVLPDGADVRAELPDGLVADPPPPPLWPWVVGVAGLLVSCGLVRAWLKRRAGRDAGRAPAVYLSPDQIALRRIEELDRMLDRAEIGGEGLVVEVSAVLRRFLQDGLGFHAIERTTEEFLSELGGSPRLEAARRKGLRTFLERCDLVKFAAQRADLELCRDLLQTARDFVRETREPIGQAREVVAATEGRDG